jgi:diamine N-acetyltransferase
VIIELKDEALLGACLEVVHAAFRTVAEELGLTEQSAPTHPAFLPLERLRGAFRKGTRMFALLADEEGVPGARPLGFVALERSARMPGVTYLERLAVLPDRRRRGLGRALLEHAVAEAGRDGAERISIGVVDEQPDLRRWYRDAGFVEVDRKRFQHLPFTVCYMERAVEQGGRPTGAPP